jgi:hypothetical protein
MAFDVQFYLRRYPDTRKLVPNEVFKSIEDHFWRDGFDEGRFPCPELERECCLLPSITCIDIFNEEYYLRSYPFVRHWCQKGRTAKNFYQSYGRRMGHLICNNDPHRKKHQSYVKGTEAYNFDAAHYSKQHKTDYPYNHYLKNRASQILDPNEWFDEEFYRLVYPHSLVDHACGFSHYCAQGINDWALFSPKLESCIPGVSKYDAAKQVYNVEYATKCNHGTMCPDAPATIWMMFDTIHPDILFGGYGSFIAFIRCLVKTGYNVSLYLRSAPSGLLRYYAQRFPNCILPSLPVYSRMDKKEFVYGPNDLFVAYSAWEAVDADHYSRSLNRPFIFFIQEYEPAFFPSGSQSFLVDSMYNRPHIALFNSQNLCDYFKQQCIGCFSPDSSLPHYVFEHLTADISPSVRITSEKKRLVFYARPEKHASRNLFEIGILALRRALYNGCFAGWEFCGIGSLTPGGKVALTENIDMTLYGKLNAQDYCNILSTSDVGLSLMFSPHPGLVHFEMADAGMITVVNVMRHRPREFFTNLSPRLLPVESSLDGIVAGLQQAEALSDNKELRHAPNSRRKASTWGDVFDKELLAHLFGSPPTREIVS